MARIMTLAFVRCSSFLQKKEVRHVKRCIYIKYLYEWDIALILEDYSLH